LNTTRANRPEMAEKSTAKRRGPGPALAVGALCFVVSGCAYSMSEFAQERQPPPTTAAVAPPAIEEPVALAPVALMDDGAPQVAATGTLPPPAPASTQPNSKLLTPEEMAKVIAELEALAKNQKVTAPRN
jgi:hypothetical protein